MTIFESVNRFHSNLPLKDYISILNEHLLLLR